MLVTTLVIGDKLVRLPGEGGRGLVMYRLKHGEGVGKRGRKTGEKTRKQGLLGEEANGRR